jgi:hypothetical protein
VRFASVSLEDSDKFDSLDRWDPRYGYYSFGGLGKTPDSPFWYTWSPQQKPVFFENHSAIFLPKDSKLLLHIHYGPTGRPEKDSSVIRLYFSTQKPSNHIQTAPLINPYAITNDSLFLPPDTKKIFHASYTLPYDIQLMSLTPQANLYCRSWEVYAMRPNEHFPIKLLKINDWNFNWKQSFFLESPITLPKGTVIHALAHYDNSFDNPCNPSDKPIPVSWGAHLFSELFFIHFQYSTILDSTSAIELLAPVVVSGPALNISMVIRKSDFYSIRICDPNGYNEKIVYTADLKKGSQKIITDIGLVKDGNYVLRVVDKNAVVVAEQLFTKMRENGM